MGGHPGADRVAGAGDEVGHAVRESRLGQQPHQVGRGERGDLAGLEDEGVARGERRGDLPTRLEEGVVPGGDQRADPDRFVDDDAVHVRAARVDHAPARLVRHQVGEVAEGGRDVVDVDAALLEGLAGVAGLDERDLLAVPLEEVRDAAEQGRPLGGGGAWPVSGVEGAAGGFDRGVGVLDAALGDDREHRRVGRVEDLPGAA